MNTIPHHHRWPAEGSAQRHWHEKLVEGRSFGGGAGRGGAVVIHFCVDTGFKEDVCLL